MAQAKADRLLSRITTLHNSLRMDTDGDGPSRVERDLMLSYLRDLYDLYLEPAPSRSPPPPAAPAPPPAPTPPPTPVSPAPAPPVAAAPPPPAPPPVPQVPVPPPPPPVVGARTATVEPSYTRPTPAPPQPAPATNLSPEVVELFAEADGNDRAAQLGRQPISDLTRSLSINNRVLFSNLLFGNNNDLLNTVLRELNGKGSMEQAKNLLFDLAQRHRWAEEERRATAKEFIELVRRRYA